MLSLKSKPAIAGACPDRLVALVVSICALMGPAPAWSQAQAAQPAAGGPMSMKEAARLAIISAPDVLSRWHSIRVAESERDAARGALLPRADFSASGGPERRRTPGSDQSVSQASGSLTLTQLLYDGFASSNEVKRLDHATKVRLFEFFDTSETVALEAVRAYLDVLRYRELVRLAEDNFVQHRAVFAQTERRVRAKVARGVDLEQATGRLALAEANLLTEVANLHDTTARFQRVVGLTAPGDLLAPVPLVQDTPANAVDALEQVQRRHPALLAAIENVRASQAALATRKGAYHPRVDLRLRRDHGKNLPGVSGHSGVSVAEVVMSWNLFNGLSDRARERQFAEQMNVAKDLRDKTCRDTRQTAMIAFNDVQKLKAQIDHLVLHEQAVTKALVAYRLQFDIGQRTLLDLLDTENELFQAKRAVVNAQQDLLFAYARTHAGTGNLLRALELTSLEGSADAALTQWNVDGDAAEHCPAEPVAVYTVSKDALLLRAADVARRIAVLNARERAIQETNAPVATALPAEGAAGEQPVKDALESWRAAWAARDTAAYLQAYAPSFVPPNGLARKDWEEGRKSIIDRAAGVAIALSDIKVSLVDADHATTTFTQSYRSASFQDTVTKTLNWERIGGRWLIVRESIGKAAPK